MYKNLEILAIATILLLAVGFADGIAEHSNREMIEGLNNPVVLVANNSENNLVPVVTPLDSGTGYLGDITIQGTAISKFDRIGAWGWDVYVDNVVEGPPEMKDKTISIYLTSADPTVYPRGTIDSNINVGDIVEAYGKPASGYDISLTGSANYYLKYLGLPVTTTHDADLSGMDEAISDTTIAPPAAWPPASPAVEPQEAPAKNLSGDGVYTILVQNGVIASIVYNAPRQAISVQGEQSPITLYDRSTSQIAGETAPADATRTTVREPYNPDWQPPDEPGLEEDPIVELLEILIHLLLL
jgi:hypothetical protein